LMGLPVFLPEAESCANRNQENNQRTFQHRTLPGRVLVAWESIGTSERRCQTGKSYPAKPTRIVSPTFWFLPSHLADAPSSAMRDPVLSVFHERGSY
jgi:hypothetical protein